MDRMISFHNEERTLATVTEWPGIWARLFHGKKARSCLVEHSEYATWNWRFRPDDKPCDRDLATALDDARRWQHLPSIPEAKVVKP